MLYKRGGCFGVETGTLLAWTQQYHTSECIEVGSHLVGANVAERRKHT